MNTLALAVCLVAPLLRGGDEPARVSPARPAPLALADRLRVAPLEEYEGNAAIGWNQVVAAAAWGADLNERLDGLLGEPAERFDVSSTRELLAANFDPLLPLMVVASRREFCDWEAPLRHGGLSVLMPELGRHRTIAKLLCLRAREAALCGDFDGAVGALRMGFELAHDLSRGKSGIQMMVGVAVGRAMLEELGRMSACTGAPSMYWALADLPRPFFPLTDVSAYEQVLVDFTLPSLRQVESLGLDDERAVGAATGAVREILAITGGATDGAEGGLAAAGRAIAGYPRAKAWMVSTGLPEERVVRLPVTYVVARHEIAEFRRASDELFRWTRLPYAEAEAGLLALAEARAKDPPPPGSLVSLLPSVERLVAASWGFDREIALLRLIEAIRLHRGEAGALPATLGEITVVPVPRDPISGEPFGYRVEDGAAVITGPAIRLSSDAKPLERRVVVTR